jgi:rhodanese-related sulfurtransferase
MNTISVEAVKARLDAGEILHVIDVREPNEYNEVNINALLLPLSQLRNFEADAIENLKEQEIIVHCKSGMRSMEACNILSQMGFKNPVNLTGGILAWLNNYPDIKLN